MKVAYVSNWPENSGWSRAGRDYILALDSVGVDVVPLPIYLGPSRCELPERIKELAKKDARGCDVVIQHVLPHMLEFNGNVLNVALYASETSDFIASGWADRLNTMDQVVVINNQMVEAAKKSGVKKPVTIIPHSLDMSRYERSYPILPSLAHFKERGEFLFYFIGEMTRRKGLYNLLKAYYLEFADSEPVRLIIKTGKPGINPEGIRQATEKHCDEIKAGLKLGGYPQQTILADEFSEEQINQLHYSCDCAVSASFGEAWSYPICDGMAFGKTPIAPASTGFLDYLSPTEGWLVGTHEEPVFSVSDTIEGLFVGSETWQAVSIPLLRKCMREAFENKQLRQEKAKAGIARAYDFSYQSVGQLFRKTLESWVINKSTGQT